MNYYNEHDPKAAAWLRALIAGGHIPDGHVDERSIADVQPGDLDRYTQCHFFAGIGGWSLALRFAGWSDDLPVWTGSCPCQPFSTAGKQLGTADERHLWPVFANLIRNCGPSVVFGEQVASAAGRGWLAGVRADLEGMGFAVGAADLCAAGVGSPHIRQRLYWMAHANKAGRSERSSSRLHDNGQSGHDLAGCRTPGGMGNANSVKHQIGRIRAAPCKKGNGNAREATGAAGSDRNAWDRFDIISCADGKARRIKPGLVPLAHGVPARVVRLRGYGNAIVPQVAAQFIEAGRGALSTLTTP